MISTMFKLVLEILGKIGIYKSRTKICPETPVFTLHARIINNNINTVGANIEGRETGVTGVIHSRKPATLLPLS